MGQIIEFKESNSSIGLLTRKTIEGPEKELIDNFIPYAIEEFSLKNCELAVFCEPCLETGFPDLVFVNYRLSAYEKWNEKRSNLNLSALKLLHFLYAEKESDSQTIIKKIGIPSKNLLFLIENLLDSNLIYRKNNFWVANSLKSIFGLCKIISIEGKVKNLSSAFKQAQLNKWFSSESFILSPILRPNNKTINTSVNVGVGIYGLKDNKIKKILDSEKFYVPSCYASWIFNEWIGRYLYSKN